jgi:hypothetical protein
MTFSYTCSRMFKTQIRKDEQNRQEDIIQIPDDAFVTCRGGCPTEEICSITKPSATEKYSKEKFSTTH